MYFLYKIYGVMVLATSNLVVSCTPSAQLPRGVSMDFFLSKVLLYIGYKRERYCFPLVCTFIKAIKSLKQM